MTNTVQDVKHLRTLNDAHIMLRNNPTFSRVPVSSIVNQTRRMSYATTWSFKKQTTLENRKLTMWLLNPPEVVSEPDKTRC